MRWLALLPLAACWTVETAAPPIAPTPAASSLAPRISPVARHAVVEHVPRHSVWTGTYKCSQGLTGATLTIDITDRVAIVEFEFFADVSNPGVPAGASRLRGTATEMPDGRLLVDADPDAWISQPTGYFMVGVTVATDPSLRELHGVMKSSTCGAIDLVRRS